MLVDLLIAGAVAAATALAVRWWKRREEEQTEEGKEVEVEAQKTTPPRPAGPPPPPPAHKTADMNKKWTVAECKKLAEDVTAEYELRKNAGAPPEVLAEIKARADALRKKCASDLE